MKHTSLYKGLVIGVIASLSLALPADAAKRGKYKEVAVKDGGSISGKVSFEGALPVDAIERIKITKNNDVCGDGDREVTWVDVKDGALRGAFVFLSKIKAGKKWAKPEMAPIWLIRRDVVLRPGPRWSGLVPSLFATVMPVCCTISTPVN